MESSFGARLRLQREQQQIALSTIAERTKIKLSLLEALERDDMSQWPGGIFRRSYVRAYAQAIGLSPDTVLREFLQRFPEPAEDVEASLAARAEAQRRSQSRLAFLFGNPFGPRPAPRQAAADEAGSAERPLERQVAPANDLPRADSESPDGIAAASSPEPAPPAGPAGQPIAESAPVPDPPAESEPAGGEHPYIATHVRRSIDIGAVASLCTRLGQALDTNDLIPVLEDLSALVDAVGAVVWIWEPHAGVLVSALAHGYSDDVLSRLPRIHREADNAIAAAFRAAATRVVDGDDQATGALVIPLLGATGGIGVLAVELRGRGEHDESVRAVLTIVAAQLSLLIGAPPLAHAATA
jgi:transcriptional regulator with XRE-family HTH domain